MIQSTNQVSLYKKMDIQLAELAGLEISSPVISYETDDHEKSFSVELEENDYIDINVNEIDTNWSPSDFNLKVTQAFTFKNPSVLFGERGITMPNNEIGIAVHLHSKSSNFQRNIPFDIIQNSTEPLQVTFEYNFTKNSIRGRLHLDFYLFLKSNSNPQPFHASKVGMRLSKEDLLNMTILVDGAGSIFPISEFEDSKGPLWKLDKNWVEANIDSFDVSNVNLCLNISHPLFPKLNAGKTKVANAMMNDIMVQAIALIIQQVILIEGCDVEQEVETTSDSILTAVRYWISTFEVDTSSLFTITNSLRANLENNLGEVNNGD